MAQQCQQYPPYDLINQALQSLSLGGKLPKFEENEVDDASILKALTDKHTMTTLPAILGVCIPAGRVPDFIGAFKAAQEHRKQVRGARSMRQQLELNPRRKRVSVNGTTSTDLTSHIMWLCLSRLRFPLLLPPPVD
jgi:hypothetical protein